MTKKTEANADTAAKPYVRVACARDDVSIESAGQHWAGTSEVPRASLTAGQIEQLKADTRLQVEEFDRPDELKRPD